MLCKILILATYSVGTAYVLLRASVRANPPPLLGRSQPATNNVVPAGWDDGHMCAPSIARGRCRDSPGGDSSGDPLATVATVASDLEHVSFHYCDA